MHIILSSQGEDRRQYIEWLDQPNEVILKSVLFDQLVGNVCFYFYKRIVSEVTEDTASFIRRSVHDMLRSKSTKEQLRSQLLTGSGILQPIIDPIIPTYDYVDSGLCIQGQLSDPERNLNSVI